MLEQRSEGHMSHLGTTGQTYLWHRELFVRSCHNISVEFVMRKCMLPTRNGRDGAVYCDSATM